jgi:hypothetical protein
MLFLKINQSIAPSHEGYVAAQGARGGGVTGPEGRGRNPILTGGLGTWKEVMKSRTTRLGMLEGVTGRGEE